MKNNQNIIKYTSHEINNFNNGKVRILQRKKDIIEFIEFSAKNPSNAKLYFGKIGERLSIDLTYGQFRISPVFKGHCEIKSTSNN